MNKLNIRALQMVLILVGLFAIYLGLDFGLGGIKPLGWQGSTDFLEVTDELRYGVQDSNFRFFEGMISAFGAFVIFAVTNLPKYEPTLKLVFASIFVGGMTRFSSGDFDVIFSTDIIIALSVELGLMSILYVWLTRALSVPE